MTFEGANNWSEYAIRRIGRSGLRGLLMPALNRPPRTSYQTNQRRCLLDPDGGGKSREALAATRSAPTASKWPGPPAGTAYRSSGSKEARRKSSIAISRHRATKTPKGRITLHHEVGIPTARNHLEKPVFRRFDRVFQGHSGFTPEGQN
jgi:hypothetical protein